MRQFEYRIALSVNFEVNACLCIIRSLVRRAVRLDVRTVAYTKQLFERSKAGHLTIRLD